MSDRVIEQLREATRAQSRRRPVAPGPGPNGDGGGSGPFGWPVVLFLILLVLGGWLVVRKIRADSQLQDCVMSGRRDCVPIDTSDPSDPAVPSLRP